MFIIDIPFLNLDAMYSLDFTFGWRKLRDGKYIIPIRDKAFKIEQKKDRFFINCSQELFYDYVFNYFGVNIDYSEINVKISKLDDYLKLCASVSSGIRLLRKSLYEVLLTFVLSSCERIGLNEANLLLRERCGVKHKNSMNEAGMVIWYEFPTASEILEKHCRLTSIREETKTILMEACNDISEGWLDECFLSDMSDNELKTYLTDFEYINDTIADYMILFGLGKSVFPYEQKIEELIQIRYNCDYETFIEWTFEDNKLSGTAQQYILYNLINENKRKEIDIWNHRNLAKKTW